MILHIMSRVDASVKMNEVYKYLLPTIASECRYMDKHITEVLTNDVLDRLYHKFDASNEVERILNMIPELPSDYDINVPSPNIDLPYGLQREMFDYIMYSLKKATCLNSKNFTLYKTNTIWLIGLIC